MNNTNNKVDGSANNTADNAANNTLTNTTLPKTVVLVILDGIGHRTDGRDNAVLHAKTPTLDRLAHTSSIVGSGAAFGLLQASGDAVGLPDGQFGNSEVGHLNIGAGRVVYQDLTRINKAIQDGDFYCNTNLLDGIKKTIDADGAVQILGLLSDGGVHAHLDHMLAMAELALQQGAKQVFLHGFLDGRDTPPTSATHYLTKTQNALDALNQQYLGTATLATLVGRFYAMDRDNRWARVQTAYDLLTLAEGADFTAENNNITNGDALNRALTALNTAYKNGESDEFVLPIVLDDNGVICDNDGVFFMNFRADRARELSMALLDPQFAEFVRKSAPQLSAFVSLAPYSDIISAYPVTQIAFNNDPLSDTLGEILAQHGKTQLRLAETEKYPHVSFFFSGGREAPFVGERRKLIPSPKVQTYDQMPEMSAPAITDALIAAIDGGELDFIVVNFANGDMVGHTGDFAAAVAAVETLDDCLARFVDNKNAIFLITADHGNCEQMIDDNGDAHTQHTARRVPFYAVNLPAKWAATNVRADGKLADLAPTVLALMGIVPPAAMTGKSLLE